MKKEHLHASLDLLQAHLSGHPLEAIITLAMETGIRRDELRHLTWAEIDLATCEMRVLNAKTSRDSRLIHLSEACTSVLRQHLLQQMDQRSLAGAAWLHRNFVFPDPTGEMLTSPRLLEEWSAFLEQGGLPPLRFHDIRVFAWQRLRVQLREIQIQQDTGQEEPETRNNDLDG